MRIGLLSQQPYDAQGHLYFQAHRSRSYRGYAGGGARGRRLSGTKCLRGSGRFMTRYETPSRLFKHAMHHRHDHYSHFGQGHCWPWCLGHIMLGLEPDYSKKNVQE